MRGGGEPRHVHPDLGDDHLCGSVTDPRDTPKQPQLPGERVGHLTDPDIEALDHPGEVVDVVGVHPRRQRVVVPEPPGTGHGQVRDLGAHHPAGELAPAGAGRVPRR
jgi:hypothetical protein